MIRKSSSDVRGRAATPPRSSTTDHVRTISCTTAAIQIKGTASGVKPTHSLCIFIPCHLFNHEYAYHSISCDLFKINIVMNLIGIPVGSCTLCFIAILLCYSFIPDNFTNYAQLSSPLCPMCTQRLQDSSDRVGALSRSSNDTVDSEDVDSASLGILPEL